MLVTNHFSSLNFLLFSLFLSLPKMNVMIKRQLQQKPRMKNYISELHDCKGEKNFISISSIRHC